MLLKAMHSKKRQIDQTRYTLKKGSIMKSLISDKNKKHKKKTNQSAITLMKSKKRLMRLFGSFVLLRVSQIVRHSIEQVVFLVPQLLDRFENLF